MKKRGFTSYRKGQGKGTSAKPKFNRGSMFKRRRMYSKPVSKFGKTNLSEIKQIEYTNGAAGSLVRFSEVVNAATLATGMTPLNLLQAGTGFYNVIGTKTVMKSIKISFHFSPGAAAVGANAAYSYRWLLVYDRQPNGVAAVITDMIETTIQTGASSTVFNSGLKRVNTKRFQIIKSDAGYISADTKDYEVVNFYKKLNHQVEYNGTANPATIANISTGALYFIVFGDQTLASTLNPVVGNFVSRIKYCD